jgi:putative ABC transport system permease protein
MLKNYLKVALRSIRKNKLYAGLNILGLSVGLASFFIIYLFIQNELAYDQFHEKKDRVYRIIDTETSGDVIVKKGSMTGAFAPLAAVGVPEIEAFSRVMFRPLMLRVIGTEDPIELSEGLEVDHGFLEIFSLDFVRGDAGSIIDAPASILLNESKAIEYFGNSDVLGEIISDGSNEYLISGVYRDLPNTSSINGDFILLRKDETTFRGHTWWHVNLNAQSYFLLKNGSQTSEVERKINKVYAENRDLNGHSFGLQALSDVHFSLDVSGPVMEKTDRQYILIFTLVAIVILACAVFNYMSLALSQSLERAKEIGVRKVIGAKRTSIYSQFITESVIQVLISSVVAIMLVELLIPQLETLIERNMGISVFQAPKLVVKGLLFSLFIAFVSAVYPAYLSTRMKVVNIFKRKSGSGSSGRIIGLVAVFQIIVFIVLICVAVTSNRQMHFMRNENLGFEQDQQLVLQGVDYRTAELLKNEVLGIAGVQYASRTANIPTKTNSVMGFKGMTSRFFLFDIDEDYLKTMGMSLLEGRNFQLEDMDSSSVIMINATAAKEIAPNGSAIGMVLPFGKDGRLYNKGDDKRIIGVVNDFHFVSKRDKVEPVLFHPIEHYSLLIVKLSTQYLSKTVDKIANVFSEHNDGKEAEYYFLDDKVEAQYKQENVMITMINTFMVVAALVAFIGLFGIAGYSVKRRTKEVGIRKVLGAGFMAIQSTLNRDSLLKLALAIAISVPLVVYWMNNWLSGFAYRIEIPYLLIFLSVVVAGAILLLVASFHSIKVFLINPVEILKDE